VVHRCQFEHQVVSNWTTWSNKVSQGRTWPPLWPTAAVRTGLGRSGGTTAISSRSDGPHVAAPGRGDGPAADGDCDRRHLAPYPGMDRLMGDIASQRLTTSTSRSRDAARGRTLCLRSAPSRLRNAFRDEGARSSAADADQRRGGRRGSRSRRNPPQARAASDLALRRRTRHRLDPAADGPARSRKACNLPAQLTAGAADGDQGCYGHRNVRSAEATRSHGRNCARGWRAQGSRSKERRSRPSSCMQSWSTRSAAVLDEEAVHLCARD
jgi:hypothetical protein